MMRSQDRAHVIMGGCTSSHHRHRALCMAFAHASACNKSQ